MTNTICSRRPSDRSPSFSWVSPLQAHVPWPIFERLASSEISLRPLFLLSSGISPRLVVLNTFSNNNSKLYTSSPDLSSVYWNAHLLPWLEGTANFISSKLNSGSLPHPHPHQDHLCVPVITDITYTRAEIQESSPSPFLRLPTS